METICTRTKATDNHPSVECAGVAAGSDVVVDGAEKATALRMSCSLCHGNFVLDVEEDWEAPPQDIEVEGREFMGIKADAVLCPRCLHSVKVAGAERTYWRLAHC